MSNNEQPPIPASSINNIDLESISDSKIAGVSVYPIRAEVTRIFKLSVKPGQNLVKINGLPNDLESDSVRVEGRGLATIHDVTVGPMPALEIEIPAALSELEERKKRIDSAVERYKKMNKAVENYLFTLRVGEVKADELDKLLDGCDTAGAKLDDKIMELKKQRMAVDKEIREQQKGAGGSKDRSWRLRTMISLSLFAENESEVELVLIYAVLNASWTPIYDIRVNTQDTEIPVTLAYKAAIRQNTAEDWENVPLTLETAMPTFQVGIPNLNTWTVSVFQPPLPPPPMPTTIVPIQSVVRQVPRARAGSKNMFRARARSSSSSSVGSTSIDSYPSPPRCAYLPPPMKVLATSISSKGNVSATFTIPGNITIPSDDAKHNVTVTQLDLEATMSWVAVPKLDAKARLSAKIKNASEYTLLSGIGSIYVDGSFIAKSDIPAVSPGESFNCALGIDPAIRITYHPVSKKLSKTGFYSKSNVHSCSQRISIYNTKSVPIKDLRILDQIPVSSDDTITVKLLTPSFSIVPSRPVGSVKDEKKVEQPALHSKVHVSQGIVAGWGHDMEDAPTTEDETTATGQDGKLSWVCEIAPQGRVDLLLQWEVTSPASTRVHNL